MASRKLNIIYVVKILFPSDGAAYQVLYQFLLYVTSFNSNLTVYRYYCYAHLQMKKLRHGQIFPK